MISQDKRFFHIIGELKILIFATSQSKTKIDSIFYQDFRIYVQGIKSGVLTKTFSIEFN